MSDVLFHSTTVRGKNEFWYSTVLALSVRNLMLFADRVLVLALVRCSSMLIAMFSEYMAIAVESVEMGGGGVD